MKRLALSVAGALVIATILTFAFVLPAEFGIDPLGTGQTLGLVGLSGKNVGETPNTASDKKPIPDTRTFYLAPYESIELKYRLESGDGLIYLWDATGAVVFDLHAEPDEGGEDKAQSFALGRAQWGSGTYVAPFTGIHGWFWENRTFDSVAVNVKTYGFMMTAIEYRDNDSISYQLGTGEE